MFDAWLHLKYEEKIVEVLKSALNDRGYAADISRLPVDVDSLEIECWVLREMPIEQLIALATNYGLKVESTNV